MKNPRKREKENPPEAFPFVGGRTKKQRRRSRSSRRDIKKAGNGGGGDLGDGCTVGYAGRQDIEAGNVDFFLFPWALNCSSLRPLF